MFVATAGLKVDALSRGLIIDSGTSQYMVFERNVLCNYKEFETPEPVRLGRYTIIALVW